MNVDPLLIVCLKNALDKYNMFVGTVLDSMVYMENPESEFKQFVNFLKIGCRFRPQDIPWN